MDSFFEILERISNIAGRYMAVIILAVAACALFVPSSLIWIRTTWVNPLLMIVMFGMGLTLKGSDFIVVFSRPKDVLIGVLCQFLIMPLLAFSLGKLFSLETALLVGVVLCGTCPGGTASNVITYLSKGDVPLSIGMTSVSTLLAPFLTPFITWLLLRANVDVDIVAMFSSIIRIVMVPIGLGLFINHFFSSVTERIKSILPLVSVTAIVMIVASVVASNSHQILSTGAIVFVVIILHNLLGYLLGFIVAKCLRMPLKKAKALSIEVGMQNAGLATSLARTGFQALPMATVPGAIFSICHNISGPILANIFSAIDEKK
ncbi:MAG: bile acid:sodium symporter family protein [Spirochaetales bacterium]|nr:bile acid:sodium symporter family protein [Spirochaetales bacterium]